LGTHTKVNKNRSHQKYNHYHQSETQKGEESNPIRLAQ